MAMNDDRSTQRLDAFADAAFAFAASLLLLGGERMPNDFAEMEAALASIPAFAFGFAVIAMFWFAHVRWRRIAGPLRGGAVLLTLLLVFLVLIYVIPLRLFAQATADYFGLAPGADAMTPAERARTFVVYGIGFAAMALTVAGLFALERRGADGARARAEIGIHLILAAAGGLSAAMALVPATSLFAAWAYAAIGPAVGLYGWKAARRARPALPRGD
jgi:uncharacterized membrane protein